MKSKCCNKPLRLSRENPEPGETMYYICDGCNQPADPKCDHGDHILCNECMEPAGLDQAQLHADDYVDKNYLDEREAGKITCSCNDFKETKWCKHMPDGTVKTGWNELTCGLPDHLFCKCENGTPCFDTCFEFKKYVDEKVREERQKCIEVFEMFGEPKCDHLHHDYKHRHSASQECPVEKELWKRYYELCDQIKESV